MGETTAIQWADATVNFWWGCAKVGPGCDNCYAETWDGRFGGDHWGIGAPRKWIKSSEGLIARLNRGVSQRVFIQSMSDIFDMEVESDWFDRAWSAIEACDRLEIQLVTKRVTAVAKRLGDRLWPAHAGLIITVVNQQEANRDIPRLLELKKRMGIPWVGLSVEPMLGPIVIPPEWLSQIDWVICGGESGREARPMHPDWVRALRDLCAAADVPFFFKQWGEWGRAQPRPSGTPGNFAIAAAGPGTDFWPQTVTPVDQYPRQFALFGGATVRERVGKRAAGRLLDGVEHNANRRGFH